MVNKAFFSLLFFCGASICFGQMSSAELKMLTLYSAESNVLPKDLLTTKTMVVISIQNETSESIRGNWKTMARDAHRYISKLGIDPVLYIYIDDLNAGYDVKRTVTNQLIRREIKNVFLLSQDRRQGQIRYTGVIAPFNLRPTFVSASQPAWKSETGDLEILFRNLMRAIDNADLVQENLLVLESPEFFQGSGILSGRRSETFNTDLRIDRVAVPSFDNIPFTGDTLSELGRLVGGENKSNLEKNGQLELIMTRYPYKFQIVPYDYDEKKLLTKGFQFVLMRVNTSGGEARKLFGYPFDEDVKELITMKKSTDGQMQIVSRPVDQTIYKYYVKHISSGDVYLGEQWDADETWQDALANHLNALLEKLGPKK